MVCPVLGSSSPGLVSRTPGSYLPSIFFPTPASTRRFQQSALQLFWWLAGAYVPRKVRNLESVKHAR
ncbi:hypothetical protein CGRA01v4_08866 [Colletotrichum graminicola]|nr:hypothetical protein CGRA01v4_08866 [Colletotrichum graminicola]